MSFAERKLRIFESWELTRGNGWRIFLVGLALFALTLMVSLVAFLGFALSAAGAVFDDDADSSAILTAMANTSAPMALGLFLLFSVVWIALSVVGAAAWADVHRQLRPVYAEAFA